MPTQNWIEEQEKWLKKHAELDKIINRKDHLHYRIFDQLVLNGIVLAAAITAATVLAAASPWAQMGACLGFTALYTIVGQPLLTLLFRREKSEKAYRSIFMTFGEAIFSPINIVILCSIAIACGLPFWGGFTTMSALYVTLAVNAGGFVITQPIRTLFSGQNSEEFVPVAHEDNIGSTEIKKGSFTAEQAMGVFAVTAAAAHQGHALAKAHQGHALAKTGGFTPTAFTLPNNQKRILTKEQKGDYFQLFKSTVVKAMQEEGENNWQQHQKEIDQIASNALAAMCTAAPCATKVHSISSSV